LILIHYDQVAFFYVYIVFASFFPVEDRTIAGKKLVCHGREWST